MFKQMPIRTPSIDAERETPTRELPPRSGNLRAIRSTANRPALVDQAADFDISKLWRDRDVHGRPRFIARALTPGERRVIERRHDELKTACSPFAAAEQNTMIAAVSRMLGGFRSLRHDDDEAAVAGLDGLRHALAPYPLWAIEAGCTAISQNNALVEGKRLDRRFPPNDSEIAAVVKEILKPYLAALHNAAALLAAPVQSTVEPAQVTRDDIEAKMGRKISDARSNEMKSPTSQSSAGDGNHAARVFADIAARKARGDMAIDDNRTTDFKADANLAG